MAWWDLQGNCNTEHVFSAALEHVALLIALEKLVCQHSSAGARKAKYTRSWLLSMIILEALSSLPRFC